MFKGWHKAPAPVITAEAIKMQRGESVKKFHDQIEKLKDEVALLEKRKGKLSEEIDDAIRSAVVNYNKKFDYLNIREQEIGEGHSKLKEERELFESASRHVRDNLNIELSNVTKEKTANSSILENIKSKEKEVKNALEKIQQDNHKLESIKLDSIKMLNDANAKLDSLEKKKSDLVSLEARINKSIDTLAIEEKVMKTNRDAMELRKKDLDHKIINAQTIKQSSHEELEKLKEEKAKLVLMKRHNDDMAKTIQEGSKKLSDNENELKMREKALSAKEKELNKREAYIKLKERGE